MITFFSTGNISLYNILKVSRSRSSEVSPLISVSHTGVKKYMTYVSILLLVMMLIQGVSFGQVLE